MLEFTEENILWLEKLIEDAKPRTDDKVKLAKLDALSKKVAKLGEERLKVTIGQKEIDEINTTLTDLQKIVERYSNMADIGALESYDGIKREMTPKLQYLATYKDMFYDEVNHLEEVLKKEIRIKIAMEIKESEGISFTQADKVVEKDTRYTVLRDQVYEIKKMANKIKTKYDFYMKTWQMVFQSVSTASKEKYTSRNNNDS
ncbi:MAG: hypothetical protein PQJ49_01820 [Sphaerochaetaceae bacterium]|nr:hypothetical protein [Sphaerochaetaceae bacterium]